MATIAEVANKFGVSEGQIKKLKNGMATVWDMIGYDCYEFLDSYDSETEMIAEMTLDAGRLEEYTRIQGGDNDWAWLDTVGKNGHSIMELGQETWDARYV